MWKFRRWLPLLALPWICGCFHLSYGTRTPTLAYELKELKKLRDRGVLTEHDFEVGKYTLLRQHSRPTLTEPDAGQLPIANLPSVDYELTDFE
jgi:hypothetical protein